MSEIISSESAEAQVLKARPSLWARLVRNPAVMIGAIMIAIIASIGPSAPLLTSLDPTEINPRSRNKPPGYETYVRDDDGNKIPIVAVMGTDSLGRDVYTRVVYGSRVSLIVGISVALISVSIGLFIGLVSGYFRIVDAIAMRIMDGLMAMPAREVAEPTEVKPGNCYIGAGGFDCVFSKRGSRIFIAPEPPEEGSLWCPSVDRMVASAMSAVATKRLRGIQLTGIGNDGARSMTQLHKSGALVIAESRESSVVFGMPGNLISMGGASKVLHQKEIGKFMMETVQK